MLSCCGTAWEVGKGALGAREKLARTCASSLVVTGYSYDGPPSLAGTLRALRISTWLMPGTLETAAVLALQQELNSYFYLGGPTVRPSLANPPAPMDCRPSDLVARLKRSASGPMGWIPAIYPGLGLRVFKLRKTESWGILST